VDLTGSLDVVATAVIAWLAMPDNKKWLAICDNYDNPRIPGNSDPAAVDICGLLPEAYQDSMIVPTRSSLLRADLSMPVRKFTEAKESVEILASMSGRAISVDDKNIPPQSIQH